MGIEQGMAMALGLRQLPGPQAKPGLRPKHKPDRQKANTRMCAWGTRDAFKSAISSIPKGLDRQARANTDTIREAFNGSAAVLRTSILCGEMF